MPVAADDEQRGREEAERRAWFFFGRVGGIRRRAADGEAKLLFVCRYFWLMNSRNFSTNRFTIYSSQFCNKRVHIINFIIYILEILNLFASLGLRSQRST